MNNQDMVFIISFLLFDKTRFFLFLFLPIEIQNKSHYYITTE
uniref:Uncharacterized protein n=1 Tax=Spiroplasma kunkelii CR2-3x TaxID=273035 RepID=Q5VCB2_SPIKU|nr:hypothetical protein SKUN_p0090 [Spiroplasma kunkelii CR2-3x]